MQKFASWLIGLSLGAAVGAVLVLLFAPASGDEIIAALKKSWAATLDDARRANAARRTELEAELARKQKKAN
jgi:gas vesicle protein